MEGLTSIPGLDKFRFEDLSKEDDSRKSDGIGQNSNEDDLNDSGPRPASLGSLGGADSLSGQDDLSPSVTQVSFDMFFIIIISNLVAMLCLGKLVNLFVSKYSH